MMNFTAPENRDVVDELVALAQQNEEDTTVLRHYFCKLKIICNEYVTITNGTDKSVYGYFATKGVKKALRFAPEMDMSAVNEKLASGKLQHGVDFFSAATDYISFVLNTIIPKLAEVDRDEGEKEGDLESQPSSPPKENLTAVNQEDAQESVDGEKGAEAKSSEDGHEEKKENEEEKGMPVTDPKEITPNDKTDEPPSKKVRAEAKKPRIPKFTPVHIPLEERKFCIFHEILEIPLLICNLPELHGFTEEELDALKFACNGSGLYGVVTPDHVLYGQPLVCERHMRRNYFHIYGPAKFPDIYVKGKLPNIGQVCKHGRGGRPVLEEGETQTNAENVKRSRTKHAKVQATIMNSYEQLCVHKNELALLVDANQLTIQSLEEEREQLSAQATFWHQQSEMYQSAWEDAKQQNQDLFQKYTELLTHAKGTSETNDTLKLELVGKDAQIFALQEELKQLRGF